jgi:CRISPR-associated protein (TIGR02584 family)
MIMPRFTPDIPASYPRRILFAVTGASPAILTETLYAIAFPPVREEGHVPTEVRVVTTAQGRDRICEQLLGAPEKEGDQLARLCNDYKLTPPTFSWDDIIVPQDSTGRVLEDIRTPEENEIMADCIVESLRELCSDGEASVHVSMAGGRKTMGFYAGYALSLFGRRQDRLTHVLVNAPFETCPGFYYPTPTRHPVKAHSGHWHNAEDARINLAYVPFVRMRDELPGFHMIKGAGFSETIRQIEQADQPTSLVINFKTRKIYCSGTEVRVTPSQLELYAYVAQKCKDGEPFNPPQSLDKVLDPDESRVRMEDAKALREDMRTVIEQFSPNCRLAESLELPDRGQLATHRTKLQQNIESRLPFRLAQKYAIHAEGRDEGSHWHLSLEPGDIDIVSEF